LVWVILAWSYLKKSSFLIDFFVTFLLFELLILILRFFLINPFEKIRKLLFFMRKIFIHFIFSLSCFGLVLVKVLISKKFKIKLRRLHLTGCFLKLTVSFRTLQFIFLFLLIKMIFWGAFKIILILCLQRLQKIRILFFISAKSDLNRRFGKIIEMKEIFREFMCTSTWWWYSSISILTSHSFGV